MNWKLLILSAVMIIIIWIGYIAYAAYTLSPRVSAQWGYVDEKTTEVWIDAKLSKPLLVPATVEELSIEFTGVPVARVARFEYGATKTDVSLVLVIDNHNLVRSLINYMDNGQSGTVAVLLQGRLLWVIPVKTEVEQWISENVLGYLNFTADSKDLAGGLVKTPALVETTFEWAGKENGRAKLVAHMKFHNPNAFPIPIGNVSFDVYANEVKIGNGKTVKTVIIPANGYATLDVETYIEEDSLPEVWAEHVRNGEVSKVRADVFLDIRVLNQDYHVKLISYEETVRTDIMAELNRLLRDMLR